MGNDSVAGVVERAAAWLAAHPDDELAAAVAAGEGAVQALADERPELAVALDLYGPESVRFLGEAPVMREALATAEVSGELVLLRLLNNATSWEEIAGILRARPEDVAQPDVARWLAAADEAPDAMRSALVALLGRVAELRAKGTAAAGAIEQALAEHDRVNQALGLADQRGSSETLAVVEALLTDGLRDDVPSYINAARALWQALPAPDEQGELHARWAQSGLWLFVLDAGGDPSLIEEAVKWTQASTWSATSEWIANLDPHRAAVIAATLDGTARWLRERSDAPAADLVLLHAQLATRAAELGALGPRREDRVHVLSEEVALVLQIENALKVGSASDIGAAATHAFNAGQRRHARWLIAYARLAFHRALDEPNANPQDQPGRLKNLAEAAKLLAERHNGGQAVLKEAITTYRKAINHPNTIVQLKPVWQHNLAVSLELLAKRFDGGKSAIQAAITTHQQAINDPNTPIQVIPAMYFNMAGSLKLSAERFDGAESAIQDAIKAYQHVLSHPETNAQIEPDTLYSLANSQRLFAERFGGGQEALESAIATYRRAIDHPHCPADHRPEFLHGLGKSLHLFASSFDGGQAALQEAINIYQQAIAEAGIEMHARLDYMASRASSLKLLAEEFRGGPQYLREAIAAYQSVINHPSANDSTKSVALYNLSHALLLLAEHFGGGQAALQETIRTGEQALNHPRTQPSDRPDLLNLIALSLGLWAVRFDGGQRALQQAVAKHHEALNHPNLRDEQEPGLLNNLATALKFFVEHFGAGQPALEEAITTYRQAVSHPFCPHDCNPLWLGNLANGLYLLAERFDGGESALEEAITTYERALAHPDTQLHDKPGILSNLANALKLRAERFDGGQSVLEQAITTHRQALDHPNAKPHNKPQFRSNLASALKLRAERFDGDVAALQQAITLYNEALNDANANPNDRLGRLNNLASTLKLLAERFDSLEATVELRSVGRLQLAALLERARLLSAAQSSPLLRAAATAARELCESFTDVDARQAVEVLEVARGVRLGEQQRRDAAALAAIEADAALLVDGYRLAVAAARVAEQGHAAGLTSSLELAAAMHRYRQAAAAIDEVAPGTFAPPSFQRIAAALPSDAAFLHLVPPTADHPGRVFLTHNDGAVKSLRLDLFTTAELQVALDTMTKISRLDPTTGEPAPPPSQPDPAPSVETARAGAVGRWQDVAGYLDQVCSQLWHQVFTPALHAFAEQLEGIDELVLVACGSFALLPLHAAGNPTQRLADRFRLRYAITASSLLAAPPSPAGRRAATACLAHPTSEHPLRYPLLEAALCARFHPPDTVLHDGDAAFDRFHPALEAATDAHISTHGQNSTTTMLNAAADHPHHVSRRDAALSLDHPELWDHAAAQQLTRRSRGEARLSACLVGAPGNDLPDEYIGLPNALLAAGFTTVLGAWWQVTDDAATLTMVRYAQLRHEHPDQPPSWCLQQTQSWLRTSTGKQLATWLDGLLGSDPDAHTHLPRADSRQIHALGTQLRDRLRASTERRPYHHPYQHAPFAIVST